MQSWPTTGPHRPDVFRPDRRPVEAVCRGLDDRAVEAFAGLEPRSLPVDPVRRAAQPPDARVGEMANLRMANESMTASRPHARLNKCQLLTVPESCFAQSNQLLYMVKLGVCPRGIPPE